MSATARGPRQTPSASCCGHEQASGAGLPPGGRAQHGAEPARGHGPQVHRHDPSDGAQRVRDPVCGMTVDPHTTPHRDAFGGRAYYFCSAGCLAKFKADPEKYLADAAGERKPQAVRENACGAAGRDVKTESGVER